LVVVAAEQTVTVVAEVAVLVVLRSVLFLYLLQTMR
jgi:hypothetical protein